MSSRNKLHRTKLDDFREWLKSRGCVIVPIKAPFEVMRWKGELGEAMPIVSERSWKRGAGRGRPHLTMNDSADSYFNAWRRDGKSPC